jgi:hypothetical protein
VAAVVVEVFIIMLAHHLLDQVEVVDIKKVGEAVELMVIMVEIALANLIIALVTVGVALVEVVEQELLE